MKTANAPATRIFVFVLMDAVREHPVHYGTPYAKKCINSFSHFHHHVKAAFHGRMRSNFRS